MTIKFHAPGIPRPGGSKRAFLHRHTGRIIVKDDCDKNKDWRATVATCAAAAMAGKPIFTGPLRVTFAFVLPRRKGDIAKDGKPKRGAPYWHTVKPDVTKLIRSTEDAMTEIVWRDDAQIGFQVGSKCYGDVAGCTIEVEDMGGAE